MLDVKAEAEKIARSLFDYATKTAIQKETGFEQCDALMTRYLSLASHLIHDLAARVRDEAMEEACRAVCIGCRGPEVFEGDGGNHHRLKRSLVEEGCVSPDWFQCDAIPIRAAFAADAKPEEPSAREGFKIIAALRRHGASEEFIEKITHELGTTNIEGATP